MRHKNIPFLPPQKKFPLALPEFTLSGGALFFFSRYNIIRKQQPGAQTAERGVINMQKKLFLGAALGLAMLANTAFAEVNTAYLANELRSYPGWPIEVYCNAADVNVRTQPNTDCDVITMLQRGDKFYVSRVVDVVNS